MMALGWRNGILPKDLPGYGTERSELKGPPKLAES